MILPTHPFSAIPFLQVAAALIQVDSTAQGLCPGHFHESNHRADSSQIVGEGLQGCHPLQQGTATVVGTFILCTIVVRVLPLRLLLLLSQKILQSFFQPDHEIVGKTKGGHIDMGSRGQIRIEEIPLEQFELVVAASQKDFSRQQ